jgi:hypothetical protein
LGKKTNRRAEAEAQSMARQCEAIEAAVREPKKLIDSNRVSEYTFDVKLSLKTLKV